MHKAVKFGMPILLALATAVSPAFARDGHNDHGRHGHDSGRSHDQDHRSYSSSGHGAHYQQARPQAYGYSRPQVRYGYNRPQVRYGHGNRGGYRGSSHWARGGRYYGNGYGPTYVVSDYYGYGLRAPPRGYYWRRSDLGDFLLVAATTGVIADLILHH